MLQAKYTEKYENYSISATCFSYNFMEIPQSPGRCALKTPLLQLFNFWVLDGLLREQTGKSQVGGRNVELGHFLGGIF